ncbi:hypothetical protein ACMGD9_14025, partial [Staphylococcus aureus]
FLYLYLLNNLNLHRSVSNAFKHLLSLDFTILNPYIIFSTSSYKIVLYKPNNFLSVTFFFGNSFNI